MDAILLETSRLEAEKRMLLDQKAIVDKRLKQLNAEILANSDDRAQIIIPTDDPQEAGYFQISTTKEIESLTKPNLQELLIQFQLTTLNTQHEPTEKEVEASKTYAMGMADWIWKHRSFKEVKHVNCVRYAALEEKKKSSEEHKESKKRKKVLPMTDDVPQTMEDFINHPHFQK